MLCKSMQESILYSSGLKDWSEQTDFGLYIYSGGNRVWAVAESEGAGPDFSHNSGIANVCLLVTLVQTEIAQQLLNGLPLHLVEI